MSSNPEYEEDPWRLIPLSSIEIKGQANIKESDGTVVDLDDLAKHVVMFISTTDIAKYLKE